MREIWKTLIFWIQTCPMWDQSQSWSQSHNQTISQMVNFEFESNKINITFSQMVNFDVDFRVVPCKINLTSSYCNSECCSVQAKRIQIGYKCQNTWIERELNDFSKECTNEERNAFISTFKDTLNWEFTKLAHSTSELVQFLSIKILQSL